MFNDKPVSNQLWDLFLSWCLHRPAKTVEIKSPKLNSQQALPGKFDASQSVLIRTCHFYYVAQTLAQRLPPHAVKRPFPSEAVVKPSICPNIDNHLTQRGGPRNKSYILSFCIPKYPSKPYLTWQFRPTALAAQEEGFPRTLLWSFSILAAALVCPIAERRSCSHRPHPIPLHESPHPQMIDIPLHIHFDWNC